MIQTLRTSYEHTNNWQKTRVPIRIIGIEFVVLVWFVTFAGWYPLAAFAALTEPTNLTGFVNNFISILNIIIPFVVSFAFFGFIIGVLKYTGAGGDEERLGKAKQLVMYGLVGVLVIFSAWGLATIIAKSYFAV